MTDGLLDGTRVIDLAGEPAAMAGRILADLGADVVLVEPPGGAPLRALPNRFTAWSRGKRTVAVAASGDLLTQFVTPLTGGNVDVTVTLSDHGPRQVDLPAKDETAAAADHPRIAAGFGV